MSSRRAERLDELGMGFAHVAKGARRDPAGAFDDFEKEPPGPFSVNDSYREHSQGRVAYGISIRT